MRWQMLASDYDRTLTVHPRGLNPKVRPALARLRAAGVKFAVCSGQPLGALQAVLPGLDGYVAENGCVRAAGREVWRHPWPERAAFQEALEDLGLPVTAFEIMLSVPRGPGETQANILPLLARHAAAVVANVDALNFSPAGETKGTGLGWLCQRLGVAPEAVVAVGDGENDVPLFHAAGLGVAVANATDPARAAAGVVLEEPDGDGVCALVERILSGDLERRHGASGPRPSAAGPPGG